MNDELVEQLRLHARAADSFVLLSGAPFTAAADEIERLRDECKNLASLLMSEYVWVHESIVPEVDKALEAYIGDKHDAPTEPASTS